MNPYHDLPAKSFWKTSVANKCMFDITDLWTPKFAITTQHNIATFGSCFAQHIGRSLKNSGYMWLNTEPMPNGLPLEKSIAYNYDIFSCRTGNIYTTSLLKQWVEWALGIKEPPVEAWYVREKVYDPFRPNIEPNGFETFNEMRFSRQQTIKSLRQIIEQSDIFIFTLGLTESWFNVEYGYEYPMCPGTVAGDFDSNNHVFCNQSFDFILNSFSDVMDMMVAVNKKIKFILTVSPIPLTATNSGNHVLIATMESKSILRAVAGQLTRSRECIDYFPSYEIINSPVYKGTFFEPNLRSVNAYGVAFVMNSFFSGLDSKLDTATINETQKKYVNICNQKNNDDVICEEELLAVFSKYSSQF